MGVGASNCCEKHRCYCGDCARKQDQERICQLERISLIKMKKISLDHLTWNQSNMCLIAVRESMPNNASCLLPYHNKRHSTSETTKSWKLELVLIFLPLYDRFFCHP